MHSYGKAWHGTLSPRVWRDKRLAALAKLKRDMDREEAAEK